jgi:hypothetical protein
MVTVTEPEVSPQVDKPNEFMIDTSTSNMVAATAQQ